MSETHLSEEDLILHHYGEAEDLAAAEAHLSACAACAAALADLRRALALVPVVAAPERDAAYGGSVFARVRTRLDRPPAAAPRPLPWRSRFAPRHFAPYAALAASLLLAFWLGRQFPADTPAPVVRERVLLVAVGQHLERSRMALVELTNAHGDGPADIRGEQQWAESLVAENRMFRQAAAHSGDTAVVGLLEELERVFTEVANGPDVLSARELSDLRARIESRGLLFKVKVVEGQVRAKTRRADTARKEMSS
jgi:anti-sigma factor RsiW